MKEWQDVIDRWCNKPPAWQRIPEDRPYGTPRAMIEAEVCPNYNAFCRFIEAVLGEEYAAKLLQPLPEQGEIGNGRSDNCNPYSDGPERGNSRDYQLRRLNRDRPDILRRLDAGEYRSVRQAAIAAGIVKPEKRISIAIDPESAARAIRRHFSDEQIDALIEALEA